jgi:hypothetical protein
MSQFMKRALIRGDGDGYAMRWAKLQQVEALWSRNSGEVSHQPNIIAVRGLTLGPDDHPRELGCCSAHKVMKQVSFAAARRTCHDNDTTRG